VGLGKSINIGSYVRSSRAKPVNKTMATPSAFIANMGSSTKRWYARHYGPNWQEIVAKEQAEKQIKQPFTEAMAMYEPGGSYGAGVEAALDRTRTKYMASGQQSLVSAGLANTTMGAGLSGKFAEEVAAPTLANVESERARIIANLKVALAQAMQGQQTQQGQLGLGYAQLGAQTQAQQGQLGLGHAQLAGQQSMAQAQLAAQTQAQQGQLGLGYAQLQAANKPSTPTSYKPQTAPSLYGATQSWAAPTVANVGKLQTWSPAELQTMNKQLGNIK